MAKILEFKRPTAIDEKAEKLLKASDLIDQLIADAVFDQELDPKDVAGILAHRLGALIRQIPEANRELLATVCRSVMEQQISKNTDNNAQ